MESRFLGKDVSHDEFSTGGDNFEIIGYTGAVLKQGSWTGIIDLEGITLEPNKERCIVLREHERDRIVGHADMTLKDGNLVFTGKFSKGTQDAFELKTLLGEDCPLQASLGVRPLSYHYAGENEVVNGNVVPEGCEVWDTSVCMEISICSLGVDAQTSVRSFAREEIGESMIINEIEPKELSAEEAAALEAGAADNEVEIEPSDSGKAAAEETVEETEDKPEEEGADGDLEEAVNLEEAEETDADVEEDGSTEGTTEASDEMDSTEEVVVEEKSFSVGEMRTFTEADLESAVKAERARVMAIFSADAPLELSLKAVEGGLTEGEAYKTFYMAEKAGKEAGLKELAANSVEIESSAVNAAVGKELGYMELIEKVKTERSLSQLEATKAVRAEYPEAFKAFINA